ncbi:MAG: hypothetical protein NVS3B2_04650 [Ramlibacter sp.]
MFARDSLACIIGRIRDEIYVLSSTHAPGPGERLQGIADELEGYASPPWPTPLQPLPKPNPSMEDRRYD